MAQVIINTKQASLLRTVMWGFGLACLLAVLIFLPYTLLQLFLGGPAVDMAGGIGSPGGGRDILYDSAPWPALLVAACFTFLMVVKLLRDPHLVARWRAALLLLLVFLLLSTCVLLQTPFVPAPNISDYYLSADTTLLLSIYPCFFASLASVFFSERHYQEDAPHKTGWLFLPLSLPAAVAGSAFCWLAITSGLSNDARYWQGYPPPHDSPLMAALHTFPTLLGVSLVGGFLGLCLFRWFHRAFSRSREPGSLAETAGSSTGRHESAPSSASATRASWPIISWSVIWRAGLAGLISLLITGILLHMSIIFSINDLPSRPFFERLVMGFEFHFDGNSWLIPPFLLSLLTLETFLLTIFSFTFLPFLLPFPGVLTGRSLWKKHAILPALGIVLIFLGMAIGAMDLLLGLLYFLFLLWPFGTISAILSCAASACTTASLALLAALALGRRRFSDRRSQRLLWLLIGFASFAGSLPALIIWLQQFTYYADNRTPFRYLSLGTPAIAAVLASSLLFCLLAALLGAWLRARLTDFLSDQPA